MLPVVTAQKMAEIDRRAQQEYGIPGLLLMEQAGIKGFDAVLHTFPEKLKKGFRTLFLAGRGNNGGDALVMAREAHVRGWEKVSVMLLPGKVNSAVELHLSLCRALGIEVVQWEKAQSSTADAQVIFDGITGTGLSGPLRGEAKEAAAFINASQAFTVSIDVPSGLHEGARKEDLMVQASCTVTMGLPKLPCFFPELRRRCGRLLLVNPGFPSQLLQNEEQRCFLLDEHSDCRLPPVDPESYKNLRGHTLVLAGSTGYTGAARLSAHGALATRTGLVTLMCDHDIYPVLSSSLPESVIVRPLGSSVEGPWTSWLCGPGWGKDPGRSDLLDALLALEIPGVIDAEGIHALSRNPRDLKGQCILTPHPGEFSLLVRPSGNTAEDLAEACRKYHAWIILKSHVTFIGGPRGELFVADVQNPAMGRAGSGDVLAGIAAGLLSEGLSVQDAAAAAVIIHQRAGRTAAGTYGWFHGGQLISAAAQEIRTVSPPVLSDPLTGHG